MSKKRWKRTIDEWTGCYPSNWRGTIIEEAMSHPAKYSSKLIRRIYEHMMDEGWLKPGDKVVDPFGGVALGAFDAMRLGLHWYGNELEPKFHELASAEYECVGIDPKDWKRWYHRPANLEFLRSNKLMCPTCANAWNDISSRKIPVREAHVFRGNIPLWNNRFGLLPRWGSAHLNNGDSRKLVEILSRNMDGAISSPPYADGARHTGGNDPHPEKLEGGTYFGVGLAGAVSSPPYAETDVNYKRNGLREDGKESYERPYMRNQTDHYGSTPGQLGSMPAQQFEASISSPPFLQSEGGTPEPKPGGAIDARLYKRHAAGNKSANGYGSTDGQLSSMKDEGFDAAISSPPYNPPMSQEHNGKRGGKRGTTPPEGDPRAFVKYGNTEGQLEGMGMDGFEAAIGSPPYGDSDQNYKEGWDRFHSNGRAPRWEKDIQRTAEYGSTDGQLSAMSSNNFDASISSPPYDETRVGKESGQEHCGHGDQYGETEGQIGGSNDFWMAARAIVEQVYQCLEPGGHAVWVVKDYVKNKQVVPFCDQWRQLCEAVGFISVHEHHAMLVHEKGTQLTLDGGMVTKKSESKSFFRRLAESKGSPRIDWEVVFCMMKPQ